MKRASSPHIVQITKRISKDKNNAAHSPSTKKRTEKQLSLHFSWLIFQLQRNTHFSLQHSEKQTFGKGKSNFLATFLFCFSSFDCKSTQNQVLSKNKSIEHQGEHQPKPMESCWGVNPPLQQGWTSSDSLPSLQLLLQWNKLRGIVAFIWGMRTVPPGLWGSLQTERDQVGSGQDVLSKLLHSLLCRFYFSSFSNTPSFIPTFNLTDPDTKSVQ